MPRLSAAPRPARILDHLRRHGDHPSGFLALASGNDFFVDPAVEGFVAYRRAGPYRFVFGGPVADAADEPRVLDRFLDDTERARQRVVAVQVQDRSAGLFAERGFVLDMMGSSYTVDLSQATLDRPAMRKPRQGVRRGQRAGARVREVGVDLPYTHSLEEQLDIVDERWLGSSGKSAKPLQFMVGSRGLPDGQRRLFVVELGGRVIGYSQCVPAFGRQPGWLYDLNRLEPGAPDVGDLQVWSVLERVQQEGAPYFHLGFTPFAELARQRSPGVPGSRATAALLRLLAEHGDRFYPTSGAVAWKRKWRPVTAAPEYVAFPSRLPLGAALRLLRVTGVV